MNGKDIESHLRRPAKNTAVYGLLFALATSLFGGAFWIGHLDSTVATLTAAEAGGTARKEARERLRKLEIGQEGIKSDVESNKKALDRIERKQNDDGKKLDQLKDLLIRRLPR